MVNKDILGIFKKMILQETLYLRHWIGKVVDDQDPMSKGRVKATVPEMGFLADSDAIWCWPRQGYALIPPAVGEWVEIYFIGGDSRRPVYLAGVAEVAGNKPALYSDPKKKVLWQDPKTGDYFQYDEGAGKYDMKIGSSTVVVNSDGTVEICGNTKNFVTHTELNSALQTFLSALKAAVAAGCSAGSGGTIAAVTLDISSSKANNIKTGG